MEVLSNDFCACIVRVDAARHMMEKMCLMTI